MRVPLCGVVVWGGMQAHALQMGCGVCWQHGMMPCRCPPCRYELLHCVRTHRGASDDSYGCVYQQEDACGKVCAASHGDSPLLSLFSM